MQNSTSAKGINKLTWEPRIVAFLCHWCSYAGADLAGVSRLQYPPNVRIIRVPCSGRIDPLFVIHAFQEGADGVIVSGCHPGDCHYQSGNLSARRKLVMLKELLEFVGIGGERLTLSWVSASEGGKFAEIIRSAVRKAKIAGPQTTLRRAQNGY